MDRMKLERNLRAAATKSQIVILVFAKGLLSKRRLLSHVGSKVPEDSL